MRGITMAVVIAAAIGVLIGTIGPWEADWVAGRTRKPAAKVIYVVVRDDGALLRGKGAKAAARTAEGTYKMTFDRPIGQCAWVATPIDPGFVTTVDVSTPNTVLVETFSTAGDRSGPHLLVAGRLLRSRGRHCPRVAGVALWCIGTDAGAVAIQGTPASRGTPSPGFR